MRTRLREWTKAGMLLTPGRGNQARGAQALHGESCGPSSAASARRPVYVRRGSSAGMPPWERTAASARRSCDLRSPHLWLSVPRLGRVLDISDHRARPCGASQRFGGECPRPSEHGRPILPASCPTLYTDRPSAAPRRSPCRGGGRRPRRRLTEFGLLVGQPPSPARLGQVKLRFRDMGQARKSRFLGRSGVFARQRQVRGRSQP
jgi:hypothetical protein